MQVYTGCEGDSVGFTVIFHIRIAGATPAHVRRIAELLDFGKNLREIPPPFRD